MTNDPSVNQGNDGWGRLPAPAPIPFVQLRSEFLSLYEPPLRAKTTRRGMRHMLDVVGSVLGAGATTADLTPSFVARLIATRPPELSPHSVRSLLVKVKVMCSYAHQQGYVRANPMGFRKTWVRVGDPVRKQHHPLADIRRVLDLLADEVLASSGWPRWRARRLQALACVVAYTGIRKLEALNLRVEDVDLAGSMIAIVERAGQRLKTISSAAPVPLPEALSPILESWMTHRMDEPEGGFPSPPNCPCLFPNVTRSNVWKDGCPGTRPLDQLKAAGERVGVEGFTFLSLRHSFATHAEGAWGLSPAQIQRCLRHTSIRTQDHYRHFDLANMRASTCGIDFGPSSSPAPERSETP
jgi:integrase